MSKEMWIYSDNEELYWEYSDEFDSKEDAIESAKEDDEIEDGYFYVGRKVEPTVCGIDLDYMLENIAENTTFGLDGYGEDFLMYVKSKHYEELEEAINEIFYNWIEKYNYRPTWFLVEDVEEIEIK